MCDTRLFAEEQIARIERARLEALRFADRCNTTIDRLTVDPEVWRGSKEMAACKRASLDLTRALAEFRKPQ